MKMKNLNLGLIVVIILVLGLSSCKKTKPQAAETNTPEISKLYNIKESKEDANVLEIYENLDHPSYEKSFFLYITPHAEEVVYTASLLKSRLVFLQPFDPEYPSIDFREVYRENLDENVIVEIPKDYNTATVLKNLKGEDYEKYAEENSKTVLFFGRNRDFFIPTKPLQSSAIEQNLKIKVRLPKKLPSQIDVSKPFRIELVYLRKDGEEVYRDFKIKKPRPEPMALTNHLYNASARKENYPLNRSIMTLDPVSFDLPSVQNIKFIHKQHVSALLDTKRAVHYDTYFQFFTKETNDSLYLSSLLKSRFIVTKVNKAGNPIEYPMIYLITKDNFGTPNDKTQPYFIGDWWPTFCMNYEYDYNSSLSGEAYKQSWKCKNDENFYKEQSITGIKIQGLKEKLFETHDRYKIEFIYVREDGKELSQHFFYQNKGWYDYYLPHQEDLTENLDHPYWGDDVDYTDETKWSFAGFINPLDLSLPCDPCRKKLPLKNLYEK